VGTIQELNGSLIINNTPKNHREIVGLLSKLRQIRSMQINVETKFLLVNQSWFEQIGFDVDLVLNANNNQFRAIQGTQPNAQPRDMFEFGQTTGRRGLQRTVGPRDYNSDGDTDDAGEGGAGVENPTSFSPIGVIQDSLGMAAGLVEGDFAGGLVAGAPALGISGQFLDDIQVDFLIVATQADKRTVQLTAPRLTFTNGQTANIFVVTQQAFVSDLEPVVGDSAVGFDPTVAVASEGVTMLMEGVISSDRRYVTLNVDAGVGRIDGFEQQPVTAVAGGELVNSADTQSFIQLPTITVTRVRTSVTVPDEGTVLLGGQRLISELEVETGVPVLSKIPIINRFFTNRIESKEEQTLLILLKPTVLIQAEQEEKRFPGLQESLSTGLR
jgi:type II secretory pathway component GspD/PulD (secretin)